MSAPNPAPGPAWHVVGQPAEELDVSNPGAPVPSQRITFQLDDSGTTGSVLVPDARIGDLSFIRAEIDARARQLAAITSLTSPK